MKKVTGVQWLVGATLMLAIWITGCGKAGEGSAQEAKSGVYGTWGGLPEMNLGTYTMTTRWKIEPNRMSHIMTCKANNGRKIEAVASAAAEITTNTLKVLEVKNQVEQDGDMICAAHIEPSKQVVRYTVQGNTLILEEGSEKITLQRQ